MKVRIGDENLRNVWLIETHGNIQEKEKSVVFWYGAYPVLILGLNESTKK